MARIHQMTISQFEADVPDEDACCGLLGGASWPMACIARAAARHVYALTTMAFNGSAWMRLGVLPLLPYRRDGLREHQ